jgi:2-methylcitrate dehydratase PrpD
MGYEAVCRIGIGVGAKYHMLKGFHPTGTNGPFGAAVAAGKVMGLSVGKVVDALGIAGSFCGGIMQFTHEASGAGEMIKRLHAGRACEGGVTAALLASGGFRGPSDILGGQHGYCNVYSDHPQIELTNRDLGSRYEIMEVGIKPYACCTTMHSIVDAMAKLREDCGLTEETIEEIRVGGSEKLVTYSSIYEVESAMAGQYSAPFCVALTLLGGITDPKNFKKVSADGSGAVLRRIMAKTKLYKDDELEALSPKIEAARVRIIMKNGQSVETEVMHAKGNPKNPMSFEDTCEKFTVLTQRKIDDKTRKQIIDMIQRLESVSNIASLTKLLICK